MARKKGVVESVVAYKGFDKDLQCRGFQYEIGKTFEHQGRVEACASGFHACENPMNVMHYYGIGDGNRFARVTLSGELSRHGNDSKVAGAKLTIDAELTLPAFIGVAVKWMIDNTAKGVTSSRKNEDAASGYSSQQAASGDYSQQAASGDYSQQAASGDYSQQAASGYSSRQAASGYSSRQAASGDSSQQAASGDYSRQELLGAHSAAAAVGHGAVIKGVVGSCIAICEWRDGKPAGFVTGIIGEGGLKADTWYQAKGGRLVEVDA